MNEHDREELKHLRSLGSSDAAADYLLAKYPRGGRYWANALILLPHISWKVRDQRRLAFEYLAELPHASPKAYEAFASFMSIANFISAIREHMGPLLQERDEFRRGLLSYHLVPVLRKRALSEKDKELVAAFVEELP